MSAETYTDELQEQIVRRLRNNAALAGMEIVHEEAKDLLNTITNTLKKMGVVIIVSSPVEDCSAKQITQPRYDRVTVAVDVVENVLFNRAETGSQQPCKTLAKRVVAALWHFRPNGMSGVLIADTPVIRNVPDQNYSIFRVQFKIGD